MVPQPDESATRRRGSRKFEDARRDSHQPGVKLPDRFKNYSDDAEEDVLPPHQGPHMFMNMNQSIFGLLAAAGSNVDFSDRFEGQSSDEDDIDRDRERQGGSDQNPLAKTAVLQKSSSTNEGGSDKHRRRLSGQLRRSLPQLPRLATRSFANRSKSKHAKSKGSAQPDSITEGVQETRREEDDTAATQSPLLEPLSADQEERLAPVMSRMLEAKAEMSSRPSFDLERFSSEQRRSESGDGGPSASALARKLKEIFGFDEPEEVRKEYPCWLLQSVLLQGYMYITSRHICFYAYLPKKTQEVARSGFLSKSGKRNPKYSRYWFRLKGDVLAYYRDASNLYFPHGQIDLRYAISANVVDPDKEGVDFSVVTHTRTYHFRAESAPSAKEWVKSLQRVIFRSHAEGDSVKISLRIENVLDIEESQMIEFADTCKVRVIDNDETYAIDEYFFSFFSFGEEAINELKSLVEHISKQHPPAAIKRLIHDDTKVDMATPRPRSPREPNSRSSVDGVPRSSDAIYQARNHCSSEPNDRPVSSDSIVQSMGDTSFIASSHEDPSGSQILRGSEVFHRPTIGRSASTSRSSNGDPPTEKRGLPRIQPHASRPSESMEAPATPTLQNIAKMGSYPLQRAGLFANYLNQTGRRMSSLLATESMGYVEKVSGMWKGGHKHYDTPGRHLTEELAEHEDADTNGELASAMDRFRAHFALPETEKLQATYFGHLIRVLPLYGKVYISDRNFCFRSLLPGTRTKLILPLKDIENVDKEKGFRFGYSGLVVVIRGHEELFFEFNQTEIRDDCAITLLHSLETTRYLREAGLLEVDEQQGADEEAMAERDALDEARLRDPTEHELKMPKDVSGLGDSTPTILFDDPKASFLNFKPTEPMKITCLTIGSRGDVQPYIALCKGLLAEGHKPRIATHAEFRTWVEGHGIEFAPVEGDPSELMRICIQNGTFTWAFLREANSKFRGWLDELLASAYTACQGSDLLIESPSAMAGIHIAEALSIPYFRAFTMPWTRTRAYPHAFVMPETKMGGAYNYVTYVMFDNVFWKATAYQVNRWRNNVLGLPNTNLEKMQPNKVPFLYNFSPAVVAPPLDYSDWIRVTGYWFLDEGSEWKPPQDLQRFIDQARKDDKKLVYVGFGSIIVPDPAKMTQEVIDGVLKADVRCILSKGWSDRMGDPKAAAPEVALPPEIFQIKSAPHDWLFRQIDAAAHHGGSGTTGASLRAGVPTIIRPFFGDQFFFGSRVEDLGVGICLKKWGAVSFARALWEATHDDRMIVKARVLGETIRKVC
ncbi:hypothetical protein F4780DRAFT_475884 [Xylariomycetidae sp. FL0641]|nr:hypothetical protein F4780DRAFT_475884 [Xylariomycetidae sp. FL0641]